MKAITSKAGRTSVRPQRPALLLTALLSALTPTSLPAQPALAPGEVLVERTMLPDARASSFAFGLPGGINVCYDPIRGGVNYIWTGGFLDISGVRPTNKLVKAATLLGPVVYRETGDAPLRRGDATRVPVIEFKGYTLRDSAVELRYTIDGAPVSETLTALPNRTGLRRTFRVDRPSADAPWFYVLAGRPASPLTRDSSGAFTLDVPFAPPAP